MLNFLWENSANFQEITDISHVIKIKNLLEFLDIKKSYKNLFEEAQNIWVVLNLFCQNTIINVTTYIPAAIQH